MVMWWEATLGFNYNGPAFWHKTRVHQTVRHQANRRVERCWFNWTSGSQDFLLYYSSTNRKCPDISASFYFKGVCIVYRWVTWGGLAVLPRLVVAAGAQSPEEDPDQSEVSAVVTWPDAALPLVTWRRASRLRRRWSRAGGGAWRGRAPPTSSPPRTPRPAGSGGTPDKFYEFTIRDSEVTLKVCPMSHGHNVNARS